MTQSSTIVAAFDYDGTLTRYDTLPFFLFYVAGPVTFLFKIFSRAPTLARLVCGQQSYDAAKREILRTFLSGMDAKEGERLGNKFSETILPKLLRVNAIQTLKQRLADGHRCVIISASPEIYLLPFARSMGKVEVIGTRLEVDASGRLTGEILGNNCYGAEKPQRLVELMGPRSGYRLIAYGNSEGDLPLLNAADEAYYCGKPYLKPSL